MKKLSSLWIVPLLLMFTAPVSAGEKPMPGHEIMNQQMQDIQKDIDKLKAQEHCMPNMTAHCQMIADLEYVEKRMAHMRTYMRFCVKSPHDCEMPEMVGEMQALNKKVAEMTKEMQAIAAKAPQTDEPRRRQ